MKNGLLNEDLPETILLLMIGASSPSSSVIFSFVISSYGEDFELELLEAMALSEFDFSSRTDSPSSESEEISRFLLFWADMTMGLSSREELMTAKAALELTGVLR